MIECNKMAIYVLPFAIWLKFFLHPGWFKYSFSVVFGFLGVKMTCNGEKKKKKGEKKKACNRR